MKKNILFLLFLLFSFSSSVFGYAERFNLYKLNLYSLVSEDETEDVIDIEEEPVVIEIEEEPTQAISDLTNHLLANGFSFANVIDVISYSNINDNHLLSTELLCILDMLSDSIADEEIDLNDIPEELIFDVPVLGDYVLFDIEQALALITFKRGTTFIINNQETINQNYHPDYQHIAINLLDYIFAEAREESVFNEKKSIFASYLRYIIAKYYSDNPLFLKSSLLENLNTTYSDRTQLKDEVEKIIQEVFVLNEVVNILETRQDSQVDGDLLALLDYARLAKTLYMLYADTDLTNINIIDEEQNDYISGEIKSFEDVLALIISKKGVLFFENNCKYLSDNYNFSVYHLLESYINLIFEAEGYNSEGNNLEEVETLKLRFLDLLTFIYSKYDLNYEELKIKLIDYLNEIYGEVELYQDIINKIEQGFRRTRKRKPVKKDSAEKENTF